MVKKLIGIVLIFTFLLTACGTFDLVGASNNIGNTGGASSNSNPPAQPGNAVDYSVPPEPTATHTSVPTVTSTVPASNPSTPVQQTFGPDNYPEGMNPLTCEMVQDPASLTIPPALISITNFPASARPQAGLSWANWVIEGYIGEGMNRFLAVFHGDYPSSDSGGSLDLPDSTTTIGPIRSGRVWYEDWRLLFDGFLVAASGAPQVLAQLNSFNYYFGSDSGDINSALIPIDTLEKIAESNSHRLKTGALNSNLCDVNAPADGVAANSFFTFYAPLNQVLWKYEPSLGAYQRYENDTVTGDNFSLMTDRINSSPLTFENVVIVYANFHGPKDAFFYIDLMYNDGPAQIMRDGKLYNIRWTTQAGDYEKTTGKDRPMRFTYLNGDPFPMKPGQTWILLAPQSAQYTMHETITEGTYIQRITQVTPGSGNWAIEIHGPTIEK